MLKNEYLLAKIVADTAENDRNFAKNWQLPYGSSAVGGRALSARPRRQPDDLHGDARGGEVVQLRVPERYLLAQSTHEGRGVQIWPYLLTFL